MVIVEDIAAVITAVITAVVMVEVTAVIMVEVMVEVVVEDHVEEEDAAIVDLHAEEVIVDLGLPDHAVTVSRDLLVQGEDTARMVAMVGMAVQDLLVLREQVLLDQQATV